MRNNETRLNDILERTAQIKAERARRRERLCGVTAVTAALLSICWFGVNIQEWIPEESSTVDLPENAASMLVDHAALGYIIMGLMAFALGVCVTTLLFRLREKRWRDDQGETDEL